MLKFFELPPSPNNTKLRMALRFKGVPFEAEAIEHANREPLVELSGQELTPVIADKGIVLNDSEAIIQYLDANYPDTPRLYPGHRKPRYQCERFKTTLDEKLGQYWSGWFFHALGLEDEPEEGARDGYLQGIEWLEKQLTRWDHQDRPINDLRIAQWATYAFPGEGFTKRVPLMSRVKQALGLEPGDYPHLSKMLVPWQARLA